jgi:hypothetical protein
MIANLGLDNVDYIPAHVGETSHVRSMIKVKMLNQALSNIYPKEAVIRPTDLVMVLDDDQVSTYLMPEL